MQARRKKGGKKVTAEKKIIYIKIYGTFYCPYRGKGLLQLMNLSNWNRSKTAAPLTWHASLASSFIFP
jgi:hypothetical protein